MQNNKKFGSFAGKGYYIALILCAAAIGITGYLYYRNLNENTLSKDPDATIQGDGNNVQAGASDPAGNGNQGDVDVISPTGPAKLTVCMPMDGQIIVEYAMECLAYNETTRDWRVHDGIDIAAEAGTQVRAVADGTVYTTYTDDSLGTTVVIRHEGGYVTVYASLSDHLLVQSGDTVQMGQAIGTVGNTANVETAIGDHLHFCVTCNGESMDPKTFLELNND